MTFDEKTLDSEYIYKGAILNLRKDKVSTINGESYREIVEHSGGAAIGVLTEEGNMVMVRQYRKPFDKVVLEVPAGKRDGDETFENVAIRELKEETGYTPGRIEDLGAMMTSPGFTNEVLHLYLATDLTKGETDFDDNEAIDICEYPLDELVEMVMTGEIEDAKSQIVILKVAELVRRRM
ncbi:MAG: NUDIX hydrolase [Firmicutes bacterium]|nr:NUDIX hydrolase [Bacillota bacterium]